MKSRLFTPKITVSTLALSCAILVGTSFVTSAKEKVVINLSPTTSWNATMIESAKPDDGYCALARKYDKGVVLTLGQSARDEYSLAIDFQNKKLNVDKPYKINLQPGPGEVRAYEMMPASAQAMVVRLGYDAGFIQSLEKSNKLKVEIDGQNYDFNTNELTKGKADLSKCMAGLRGEPTTKTAAFSAEKIDNKEAFKKPVTQVKKPVAKKAEEVKPALAMPPVPTPEKIATPKVKQEIEVPKAVIVPPPVEVKAKPIQIARIDSQKKAIPTPKVEPKKIEVKQAVKKVEPKAVIAPPPVEVKKVETPKPEVPKAKAEKFIATVEPTIVSTDKAPSVLAMNNRVSQSPSFGDVTNERPTSVSAKNKKYGATPKASIVTPKAIKAPAPVEMKAETILMEQAPKRAKAQTQVMAKVDPLPAAKVEAPQKIRKAPASVLKTPEEMKASSSNKVAEIAPDMKDTSKFPKPFSGSSNKTKAEPPVFKEPKEQVALKEIPRAPSEVASIKDVAETMKPKSTSSKGNFKTRSDSPKGLANVSPDLVGQISKMQEDNVQKTLALKEEEKRLGKDGVRNARNEKELTEVRKELAALEKENLELYKEARKARGQIDMAVTESGSEALRKMRTYEKRLEAANADNVALSRQIEELRVSQENVNLASVSGDPATQQSMRRYNEAEREIQRLGLLLEQQRLSHTQERKELEGMLFDPAITDNAQRRKLEDLNKKLADAEKRLEAEAKKVNLVDVESKKKLEVLEKQLAETKLREKALKAEEAKVKAEEQKMKMEASRIAAAEVKLAALTQKEEALKVKEQRLKEEEQKLSDAENKMAQAQLKEQELRAQQAKMRMEAQKIAQAEAKLAQARMKEQQLAKVEAELAAKTQAIAATQAKENLAEAARKEAALRDAQAQLAAQTKKVAPYSPERVTPRQPMAVVSPNAIAPVGRNIRSNTPKAPIVNSSTAAFGSSNIQQILNQSGLSSVSNVNQQGAGRYSWNAAGMQGKAEVASSAQMKNLGQFAQSYIAREKKSCSGDFASLPARVPNGKQGYEIACVGPTGGKSASVVFAQQGPNLIAITHETSAENMDAAIEARDRVASRL